MTNDGLEWQVTVFCQNEASRIRACLASIVAAIGSHRALITVIVNGSTDDSETLARDASVGLGTPVTIFRIRHGDKSNAINTFLYNRSVRADAELYFCVDGYVTIGAAALSAIATRIAECPDAVAASRVAINGRTEPQSTRQAVEVGGVLKGQFYALKPAFVTRMVEAGIRIPIGLYRGDGLLGSMCAHNLDAMGEPWQNHRLIGVASAGFEIDPLSISKPKELRRQFRRTIRQMRGKIENEAVKSIIYRGGYEALPSFADHMIRDYLGEYPVPTVPLKYRPFMELALRQHRAATLPNPSDLQPIKVL